MRTAKEIQRHVQKQLEESEERRRLQEEADEADREMNKHISERSNGKKRSASVDSSKFKSPKRSLKSATPDLMV